MNKCFLPLRILRPSFLQLTFLTLLITPLCLPLFLRAQVSQIYTQKDRNFQDAVEFFQNGKYEVAMQLFKKTIDEISYFQQTNRQLTLQDAQYYYAICALKLNQPNGVILTKNFIRQVNNGARVQLASFELAQHYFQQNKFREAIPYYEKTGIENLSNQQIADAKFELAFSYFNVKDFTRALPLFASIKDIHNKYFIPANYYYGFISYYNKEYPQALSSFKRVVQEPQYNIIVPYYIAEIYYYQGNLDQVISYSQPFLNQGNLYYDKDLRHLVGQAYFEKKEYAQALPYLSGYINNEDQVLQEDIYELSYCYYQTNHLHKAIAGFQQLSSSSDSLGQNSMYLLGNCYLKTGQKNSARNAFAFCARYPYNPLQRKFPYLIMGNYPMS
ncbi:MAG: tetratricopeptide repeat protein [Chitinophagaceae bacterium]